VLVVKGASHASIRSHVVALTAVVGDASTRSFASVLFAFAAAAFAASGAGIALPSGVVAPSAHGFGRVLLGALPPVLGWRVDTPVDKGLIGLLINAAIHGLPMFVERQTAAS
jgi:hypothetical protein